MFLVASALTAFCAGTEPNEVLPRFETVLIKGATFTMGTPIRNKRDPKYHDDEAPLEVTVEDFRISKYPITAEQMCAFLNSPAATKYDRESLYYHHDLGLSRDDLVPFSTITMTVDGQYVPRKGACQGTRESSDLEGCGLVLQMAQCRDW